MAKPAIAWGFRVASRPETGAGHVMRSAALAAAMDAPVTFYLDPGAPWQPWLSEQSFGVVNDSSARSSSRLLSDMAGGRIGAALFDGYDFESTDRMKAAQLGLTVEVRDAPGRALGHVTIDSGIAARPEDYRGSHAKVLAGPRFALLRPEFEGAHAAALARRPAEACGRILVSFGAADTVNATGIVLEAIVDMKARPPITVVLGGKSPNLARVREIAQRADVEICTDVQDMPEIYARHQLAVGAGGVSLLERMCCGLPSIVITIADNQEVNARGAAAQGAADYLGPAGEVDTGRLRATVSALLEDSGKRAALRQRGLDMVDGLGAKRAATELQTVLGNSRVHKVSI